MAFAPASTIGTDEPGFGRSERGRRAALLATAALPLLLATGVAASAANGTPGATGGNVTRSAGSDTTRNVTLTVVGGTGGTGGAGTSGATFAGTATFGGVAVGGDGGTGGTGGIGEADTRSGASTGSASATATGMGGTGGTGGAGGNGIDVSGRGTALTLPGSSVLGGNGGVGGFGGGGAASATSIAQDPAGVATSTANAVNGTGGTGGTGGIGIAFDSRRGTLVNASGLVAGGRGGDGGPATAPERGQGSSASAAASPGGAPPSAAAQSGDGAAVATSTAARMNLPSESAAGAAIGGGEGAAAANSASGAGATNTALANAAADTTGAGGNGGHGAAGVLVSTSGVTFVNSGRVLGGMGGPGAAGENARRNGNGGRGGDGGVGVAFLRGRSQLTNSGVIVGGSGGNAGAGGGSGAAGSGGNGAAGVFFAAGHSKLTNTASAVIFGGSGQGGGQSAAAVVGNGVTIDNAGLLLGGGNTYAIVFTGGRNAVGGAGRIIGGIVVEGRASFQPALPGSALGTPLAITGPLVFARTSTYTIRISPSANDSAAVTGVATLNGANVRVKANGGAPTPRMRYTILTATGGVAGRFSGVTSNLAFFAPRLSYDANDVFLTARYNYLLPGGTLNEMRVGAGLNNAARLPRSGTAQAIFAALNQVTKTQGPAVLDSLSGEGITAAQNIAQRSSQMFTSSIFDQTTFYGDGGAANSITLMAPTPGFVALAPEQTLAASRAGQPVRELADLPASQVRPSDTPPVFVAPQRTWRAWATGFGGTEDIHGNAVIGSARQDNSIYGGSLGVDYQVTPNYLAGIAIGGTNGDFRVAARGTSGSTTGGHIAFYDIYTLGNFYGASSNSFSYYTNRSTRFVSGFGGLGNESERGDFDSHEFRTRLEFGRHFVTNKGTITPFVALEIADLRSNGFGETNVSGPGLFRLNVNGQSAADVPGFVGARFQSLMALGNGMVLSPTLQVAYVHEFAPYRQQIGNLSALPGATFLVDGARPSENAAQVKAGGELQIGPHSSLFANFDGEFSGVDQLYAGKGGFRYVW